jgi:hypothetical protein
VTSRSFIAAGYVAVFVLGAVTGAAVTQGLRADRQIALLEQPSRRVATYLWSLDQKLKLASEQRQHIESILGRYEPQRRAAMSPVEPQLTELRLRMRHEIREVLDPKQQELFDELGRQRDEERSHRSPLAQDPQPPGQ